jgi:hypothetical protein
MPRDVRAWTSAQVQMFLERSQILRDAQMFRREKIDGGAWARVCERTFGPGTALMLLGIDEMRQRLRLSLAKALKVRNLVMTVLRGKVLNPITH